MKKYSDKWYKVQALKHARKQIEEGYERYICLALSDYAFSGGSDTLKKVQAVDYLRDYIEAQLNGHDTFHWWLMHEKGFGNHYQDFNQYRIQWIDWMIACYMEDE
jgi:hypothetical protein